MKKETIKVYATYHEVGLIGRFLSGELKEGSSENLTARRALARLLRTPAQRLDLGLRWTLADLIDADIRCPDRKTKGYYEQPHIFVLKRRQPRGQPVKPRDAATERKIAEFIWHRHGKRQMKEIIRDAAKKFGVSRTRVYEIWKDWRPVLKRDFRSRDRAPRPNYSPFKPDLL